MKKVCIALDTSPSAEKVAKLGYEWAKVLNAEVVLIHVMYNFSMYTYNYEPIMGYKGFFTQRDLNIVGGLKQETENFLQTTTKFLGDPNLETKVLEGETDEEILQFAEDWGADLLVIGTHSHSVLENVLVGNIAAKIVKHCKIPLLIVPTKV